MITRLTSSASNKQILTDLQVAGRNLADIQNQLTTGRRINKMSDAPSDAVSSLTQRASLHRNDQFARNIGEANDWLGLQDSALSSVNDKLTSVRTLLLQAQSGTQTPSSRQAIADQISAIRDSLLADANAQRLGRPLFGGTTAGAAAFDAAGNYIGDNGNVDVPVSPNTTLTVNHTGPNVFGTHNVGTPTNGDVFQVLAQLAISVQTGDTSAMTAGISQVDTATDRVATAQVQIGSRVNQLDGLKAANDNASVTLKSAISQIEDVDLADSLVALKTREAGYQAALQATSRVVQLSLMDFLK